MEQILISSRYKELCDLLSGIGDSKEGISNKEILHLTWLGANVSPGGAIVDIGSHKGKSICAMGVGALEAGNKTVKLFAVDPWTIGTTNFAHQRSQEAYDTFLQQTAQMGLSDNIRVCMASSLEAASKRGKSVHLLFIDASHKYLNVLDDYRAWCNFIPHGGRIAFHDYNTRFEGVQKVVDDIVVPSGEWKDYYICDHIWSATRV